MLKKLLDSICAFAEMAFYTTSDSNDTHTNNTTHNDNNPKSEFFRQISPKPGSVSVVIGSFKSICAKHIRKTFPDMGFAWQPRFYDHIIRDQPSFHRISQYIINNPQKWTEDEYNKFLK